MSIASFKKRVESADLSMESAFHDLFNEAYEYLELSEQDVARIFTINRSTINRWLHQQTAPHEFMRLPVLIELSRRVAQKAAVRKRAEKRKGSRGGGSAPSPVVSCAAEPA